MDEISGWRADPFGVHQERFFDWKGAPTHVVRNDGHESYEPPESNDPILNPDNSSGNTVAVTLATESDTPSLETHAEVMPIRVAH